MDHSAYPRTAQKGDGEEVLAGLDILGLSPLISPEE